MSRELMDVSIDDPALPFTHAFEYAFDKSKAVMHQYDNDGEYTNKVADNVAPYFQDHLDLTIPENSDSLNHTNILFTNGTTNDFAMILDAIANEHKQYHSVVISYSCPYDVVRHICFWAMTH